MRTIIIDNRAYFITYDIEMSILGAISDNESQDEERQMRGRNNIDKLVKYITDNCCMVSCGNYCFVASEQENRNYELKKL